MTNHAIVAMVEDDVKQTRCTTCDTEHVYKGAKVPKRRKKDAPAVVPALGAAIPAGQLATSPAVDDLDDLPEDDLDPVDDEPLPAVSAAVSGLAEAEPVRDLEDGPVHRPLIRATLPRPEGHQKDVRPLPEFTVRQPGSRGGNGHFRGAGKMRGQAPNNGNRPAGRFAGPRHGAPGRGPGGRPGAAPGFRSGPPRHGGKKRSR